MEIRPLSPTDVAVRAFVETLWVPYHRELAATVERHALADRPDADLIDAETTFRKDWLRTDGCGLWVAVDRSATDTDDGDPAWRIPSDPPETSVSVPGNSVEPSVADAPLAGFLSVEVDPAPPVFDKPDRLVVCDVYVRDPYRGTGLAHDLLGLAADRARAHDCPRVALDVDVDNDRARAFYEKFGFTAVRHRLELDSDAL